MAWALDGFERRLLLRIHEHAWPSLDRAFLASHYLGKVSVCAVLVAAGAATHLQRGQRRHAARLAGLGAGTYLLQALLKPLARRRRPELWRGRARENGASFPSGHALAAAALFPALADAFADRGAWRRSARAASLGAALMVGLGRLYLGLHWPTDVLAGWLLGAGQLRLARGLVRDEG